jgi:hypothetical protein
MDGFYPITSRPKNDIPGREIRTLSFEHLTYFTIVQFTLVQCNYLRSNTWWVCQKFINPSILVHVLVYLITKSAITEIVTVQMFEM